MCRDSGSTVEITRSGATSWAIRHVPSVVAGLDVLARDQRQQPDRIGLGVIEGDAIERADDRQRVVHQPATSAVLASGSSHAHTGLPDAS